MITIFKNLLNCYEVIEVLLQNQDSTKYLLRPIAPNDGNRHLREAKNKLIYGIISRGKGDWAGLELSEYSRNLEKLMEGKQQEQVYAMDV